MHPELRSRFNADFTPDKYAALLRCVNETEKWPADFRVSETPIFLTGEFTDEVIRAANAIVDLTQTSEFARHARSRFVNEHQEIAAKRRQPRLCHIPNETIVNSGVAMNHLFTISSGSAEAVPNGKPIPSFLRISGTPCTKLCPAAELTGCFSLRCTFRSSSRAKPAPHCLHR